MDGVEAPVGEGLHGGGQAGDADAQVGVEGHVDLGHGRQAPVDLGVGSEDLDLVAGHAALADLGDRARDAVGRADAVDHDRHPRRLAVAGAALAGALGEAAGPGRVGDFGQLDLLVREERGGGRVGDGGDARFEDALGGGLEVGASRGGAQGDVHGAAQLALVDPAGPAVEAGVAEALVLHHREQPLLVEVIELDRAQPGAQQAARVIRGEIARHGAVARVGLPQQAAHHLHHPQGVRARGRRACRVEAERAHGQRDRGVGPLGGAALGSAGEHSPGAHVLQELRGGGGRRRFRERAPDVDPRVVV